MDTSHNHTTPSRQRAIYLDESGTSAERHASIHSALVWAGASGLTSREYADKAGYDSLPSWVTGAFSDLHKAGEISRLAERRGLTNTAPAYVYVLPSMVVGRPEKPFKSNSGVTADMRIHFAWAITQIEEKASKSPQWAQVADDLRRLL